MQDGANSTDIDSMGSPHSPPSISHKKNAAAAAAAGGASNLLPGVAAYPNGGFVVRSGDLSFSVGVFCTCATLCFVVLAFRRACLGYAHPPLLQSVPQMPPSLIPGPLRV